MVLGVIFSLVGIGILIAIMFQMAIFALPLFIAVTAGRSAYETGTGVMGAIIIGLIAAIVAFGVAQLILATTSSTALRIIIAAAFAAPAAFAGYHVVLGLSHIGGAHGVAADLRGSRRDHHRRRGAGAPRDAHHPGAGLGAAGLIFGCATTTATG